jgi:bifunctional UDP-N-acetylglucosamine pyrophosphorylase / glucosamine-1-phosphate N-acetyltransferase
VKGLAVIVLAAGLGTRMRSATVKVLHRIAGRPMLSHTLANVLGLKPDRTVVVLGHQSDDVRKVLPDTVEAAIQKEQLGTAHAVICGLKKLRGHKGTVMVVSGDTPLLDAGALKAVATAHRRKRSDITVLTAVLDDPYGYGRIIRNGSGVAAIVEEKDASADQKRINEVNTGTYCFETDTLRSALRKVRAANAQKEFYLTDVVELTSISGGRVSAAQAANPEEALGINSRADLAVAERLLRRKTNRRLMDSGVTMTDPDATYVDTGVIIGRDTVVHPGNHITGNTVIGERCVLMPGNVISDSTIKDGVVVKGYSVITNACVDDGASVGPFAHLRPGSRLEPETRVGNFVELKKTLMGFGSKASHLSYLGDTVVGRDVNIGAGTITCNYDGFDKHTTVIEDGVFVGSDTQLVAPVRLGRGSLVAAGTTVTEDVPPDALVISRAPQNVSEGWAKVWRSRKASRKTKGKRR